MLPFVLLLPLLGYGWGHWAQRLPLTGLADLLPLLPAWTLLHAGTLWLNAALDRDEDAVLFGRAVAVPRAAPVAGYLALLACVGLAALSRPPALLAAAGCAALAVLYSHPATRWKAHPLGGPLVNALGYGLLSPLAGWAAVGVPADRVTWLVAPLLPLGLLAPTFAAQAFQGEADRARGYRTLVVTRGPRACVRAARGALGLALAWGLALALAGVVPRLCLLGALPWLGVDRFLAAWEARASEADPRLPRDLVLGMLAATLATVGLAAVDVLVRRGG